MKNKSIDDYLISVAEITTTSAEGDFTSGEVKKELHISNPKYFDLLNKGELEAYYVGSQTRVKRQSLINYKIQNTYIPTKV